LEEEEGRMGRVDDDEDDDVKGGGVQVAAGQLSVGV
jgi:hypothetical protein